ncbi:hypothetical protein [Oceanobacillus profundus]|uniref:hypothetical protein n=1 Tax=Oceanobacillus TaxID=182709 RepID=UPI0026E1EFF8|nr:hypothetical protein [Oceanobacillus profundus]MDO6449042.1 hypothetical protein [Oceanobacillus profundus]
MGTVIRWLLAIFFTYFAIITLQTGLELLSASREDGAIAVRFLSFEINNQVDSENMASYTIAFFAGALVAMILALSLMKDAFSSLKGKS